MESSQKESDSKVSEKVSTGNVPKESDSNGKNPASDSKNPATSDEDSKTLTHSCSCPHHNYELKAKDDSSEKGSLLLITGEVFVTYASSFPTAKVLLGIFFKYGQPLPLFGFNNCSLQSRLQQLFNRPRPCSSVGTRQRSS